MSSFWFMAAADTPNQLRMVDCVSGEDVDVNIPIKVDVATDTKAMKGVIIAILVIEDEVPYLRMAVKLFQRQ